MLQDAEGNHYQYDAKDQLIDFLSKDKINEYMHYDAENMRDGYVVKGEHLGFIYTDDDLVNTTEPQVKKKSAYLLREVRYIDDLNQANQANRSTQYFVKGNKNTTSILLLSNSGITNFYHYDPYGKRRRINTQQSNSDQIKQTALNHNVIDDNPLGYNGEYQDIFSGLIYLRARFYNPVVQRFIQRDNYHLVNRYNAFNDNPINNIDPSGHSAGSGMLNFLSGLGDGLISGISIGFCTSHNCSVQTYKQLFNGDSEAWAEFFDPIAALIPLFKHNGDEDQWAYAFGVSLPNIVITGGDLLTALQANDLKNLIRQNKNDANMHIAEGTERNSSKRIALKAFSRKIISRRSVVNYLSEPVAYMWRKYDQYIKGIVEEDITRKIQKFEDPNMFLLKKYYKYKGVDTKVDKIYSYVTKAQMALYAINTNSLNQYNQVRSQLL